HSMVMGSVFLLPFLPFHSDIREFASLSVTGWLVLLFTVIFSIVVAFFLWYRGVSKIGPSRTIIYQYSIPVFAAFFAFLLLNEKLYFSQLVGAGIVFFSLRMARKS